MTKAGMGWAAAVMLCAVAGSSMAFASTATRSSGFAYDTTSGLLTQEVVEPNTTALRLETDYTYDVFGNKLSMTVSGADIVSRSSSNTYDAKGQFPTGASNALGQSESWQYDARFGQPTSHTGPNGLTTTWSYDGYGRKVLEIRPDGTRTTMAYFFCSGVNNGPVSCPAGASYQVRVTTLASDGVSQNGPYVFVYFDLLDREVARDTQGFDGSIVRASKQYDSFGRVQQTSRPYLATGGTPQWTTFTYDALGRVLTATAPDGSVTQNAYHGLVTAETNALNQTRTVTKNSQGKVVSVTDALNATMTYAYDAMNNLVSTTDAVGNVVRATYDVRGRKIASNDPDMGAWTYTYNTLGELVSQTDARGNLTSQIYDKLSRPVQRTEADATAAWSYDTAANGIGKLATAAITAGTGAGYQRSYVYDTLGRPVQIATTIDATVYTMAAGYDGNSRLTSVTYPSGFVAAYRYNSLGYAYQLADGSTNQVHWTLNALDVEQHITQQTFGNGVVGKNSFEATTGRLLSVVAGTVSGTSNVADFTYTYDRLANPLSRTDGNTNLSESFGYDSLNRLTSSTTSLSPTPLVKAFTYSAIGNLLSKSDLGTYAYPAAGSPQPHAVMSINMGRITTNYTYDAVGNQTAGFGRTLSYTSFNKPASITQGTRTVSFSHGPDHQRFKQVAPEGTTLYISGFGVLAELFKSTTSQWTDYLSVGNAKVGMRVINTATETLTTRYFHTDHLGSIAVITNENGVVVERLSYDAWGKRRFPNGTDDPTGSITSETTRGFTGHEMLADVGLVHMNGRVYDPLIARMTSADPTVPDPLNAQAWNRYSYVGNDPLAFTDPTGFSWLSSFFHSVSHAISNVVSSVAHFLTSNPIVKAIVQIGTTVFLTAVLGPAGALSSLGLTTAAAGITAAAASAVIVTGLSGGNLSQVLKAGAIAGVTAFAFFEVGEFTGHNPSFGTSEYAENVAGHALVGCGVSVANGSSCGPGALSGAITSAAGPLINGQSYGVALVENAVIGGVASVAGGGKFENGAITGAFGYLFNFLQCDPVGQTCFASKPTLQENAAHWQDGTGWPVYRFGNDLDLSDYSANGFSGKYIEPSMGQFASAWWNVFHSNQASQGDNDMISYGTLNLSNQGDKTVQVMPDLYNYDTQTGRSVRNTMTDFLKGQTGSASVNGANFKTIFMGPTTTP